MDNANPTPFELKLLAERNAPRLAEESAFSVRMMRAQQEIARLRTALLDVVNRPDVAIWTAANALRIDKRE